MNTLQLQHPASIKWTHAQVPVFEEQWDYVLPPLKSLVVICVWGLDGKKKSIKTDKVT